jgi:predicted lipid-binding transport protein (Tim44 family)
MLRKSLLLFLVSLLAFTFALEANAKRFGGGKSFGMQRANTHYSRTAPKAATPANTNKTANKWLGPLAGLALGGLLASLFMGHGIGTGILSWLLLGGACFLLWNLFRKRIQPALSSNYAPRAHSQAAFSAEESRSGGISEHFDTHHFLRDSKVQFLRLQTAYDTKNLSDLRQFTTPEIFGEIQLQIQERGNALNQTEVISLNAELMDVSEENKKMLAAVRFSGLIREEVQKEPVSFDETWHFCKDHLQQEWSVAGIQQNN